MLLPIIAVMSILAVLIVTLVEGGADEGQTISATDLPLWGTALFSLLQQLALLAWPLIVSKWKGLGPASDWGLTFHKEDLWIGLGVGIIALFSAGVANVVASLAVGLEDSESAGNLDVLTSAQGTVWFWVLVLTVVLVAPVAEEVLFRGLILRSVKNRFGTVVAVIAVLAVFVPLHRADGGYFSGGQVVLMAGIGALALTFTMAAVITERLGPSIVAHVVVNGAGAAGAISGLNAGGWLPVYY